MKYTDPKIYWSMVKNDFPTFIARSFASIDPASEYQHNWHIEVIAEYLEAVRKKEIRRLIINMPPRSLKSVCISVAWPAWLLGHRPATRVISSSYSAALSVKHALDSRLIINEDWYKMLFPGMMIAAGQNEKHKFVTTKRGFRFSTSTCGTVTGEGGDILIVDDPLDPKMAMSPLQRSNANQWFDQTFSTRLNNKKEGGIVIVMQRLHEDDLSGHLLAKGGWEHLSIESIAENKTLFNIGNINYQREDGALLHSAREDSDILAEVKNAMGSAAFSAQYQQAPISSNCAMVKMEWFERYNKNDFAYCHYESIVQSWDTAIKTGQNNDPTVCITFGIKDSVHHIINVFKARLDYPSLKRKIYDMADEQAPDIILIEDKASGQSLLQDLRRESSLPVIPRMPKYDKVMRFAAITPFLESGRVSLPEYAHWLEDFETEILSFPGSKHDDQVDALSQYLGWVNENISASSPGMRKI